MSPRAARMAMLAALLLALPASAQAAAPSAYVYATSWDAQGARQFAADDTGALAPLAPPDVAAGSSSTGAVASPDGDSLYVVNQASADVSQYDVAADGTLTPKTPATVAAGASPFGAAITPDGAHLYVANQGDGTVSVFDVGSGGTLTLASSVAAEAGAIQVALTPDGTSAYVSNLSAGTVSQYDVAADGSLTPKAAGPIDASPAPAGLAVSPDGASLYVANRANPGTISQFDIGAGGALSPKATPKVAAETQPIAIAATSAGVYASNFGAGTISAYDAGADGALTPNGSVAAGRNPWGLTASPDGRSLYAAAFSDGDVLQFDVASDGTLAPKAAPAVDAGAHPIAVAAVEGEPVAPPRDEQAPTIDLRTPAEGAQYGLLASAKADYSCADEGGSGLVSCVGDVADGDQLDTLGLGEHSFRVTARDGAGNTTTVTHRYTVNLLWSGFVGAVQDGATIRAGATIPVVFSLGGDRGTNVLASGSPTTGRARCGDTGAPWKREAAQGYLRYDATSGNYVFKWRTQKSWAGTCRTFALTLSDGSVHRMNLKFKRYCPTIVAARR